MCRGAMASARRCVVGAAIRAGPEPDARAIAMRPPSHSTGSGAVRLATTAFQWIGVIQKPAPPGRAGAHWLRSLSTAAGGKGAAAPWRTNRVRRMSTQSDSSAKPPTRRAALALEDGTRFEGWSFGAHKGV